jgi:hypothetical protein
MLTLARQAFRKLCHAVPDRSVTPNGTTPSSFQLVPVVVSPGPDRKLGLDTVRLQTNQASGDENDNLDTVP